MDCQKHFQFILMKEKDDLISVKCRIVARRFPYFTECQNVLIEKNWRKMLKVKLKPPSPNSAISSSTWNSIGIFKIQNLIAFLF